MNDEIGTSSQTSKKRRLNYACERCRSKKTRCDDRYPECTNCYKAGADCVTRDPRNPRAVVVRHEAQLAPTSYHAPEETTAPIAQDTPLSVSSVGSAVRRNTLMTEIEDAIQPPGQGRATARLPVFPRFMNGNSLYILTQWLDLAFVRLNHSSRFSHLYKETKFQTTRPVLQDEEVDEILNDVTQYQSILDNFLSTVHSVFKLEAEEQWAAVLGASRASRPTHAILRALLLALSDHPSARCSLELAFSRINVIIQSSDCESLLALFLMIVAFRGFNDSHTAVHLLSIANSIVHGLGLDSTNSGPDPSYADIWWSLFAIDKALAIELERKPVIRMETGNKPEPVNNETLTAITELAKIQETIVNRVMLEREMEDSRDRTLNEIIVHKMKSAGELDELLLEWEMNLPRHMRISDHPCADEDGLLGMVYMALQYHQCQFAIHRNSLITNAKHIRNLADEAFSDQAYRLRLRNGALICYSTAKSIITLVSHINDQGKQSSLDTTYSLLIAAIGLAIYIYKHPNTSVVHSDLQLLSTAVTFIERRALASGGVLQDQNLGKLLRALHADLEARATSHRPLSLPNDGHQDQQTNYEQIDDILNVEDRSDARLDTNAGNLDSTDFNTSLFTDDIANWPDFLELLDLSSPLASFARNTFER